MVFFTVEVIGSKFPDRNIRRIIDIQVNNYK